MKSFKEKWSYDEINEYVKQFNILILFEIHELFNEVTVIPHGNFSDDNAKVLLIKISDKYGGKLINKKMCIKINEFAGHLTNHIIVKLMLML